jgi:hypothetical protein
MFDGCVAPQSGIPHRFNYIKVHHDSIQNAHVLKGFARLPVEY